MEEQVKHPDLRELATQLTLRIEKLEQELTTCVKKQDLMRIFNEQLESQSRAVGGL